jgi:DNA-binding MarR family transcriptional regulator
MSTAGHRAPVDPPDPLVAGLYGVLMYVRPLHRFAAQAVADALEGTGVTVAARAVLERLVLDGPQPVPHVAQVLALPRQAVQRVVNELLALGLVETRPNPAHRRSQLVAATPAGTARLRGLRDHEDASLAEVAAGLDPADVEGAVRVLAALTGHFRDLTAAHRAAGTHAPDQTLAVDSDVLGVHPTEGPP